MSLTEKSVVDLIEIVEDGVVRVRTATVILKDDKEISRSFHRHILEPGSNLDGQAARVSAVATATWTDEVVSNYKASLPKEIT